MNNSLKVALGHLSHTTTGRHSVYMPINIGYIGAYARSVLGEENIELRLYSEADHMSQDITDWKPDVVATANYVWNSEIGLAILKIAREVNPDVVCVAGGPEIPELPEDRKAYLDDRPQIDLYAYIEGELPFGELVKKIYAGASAIELRREPQPGLIALHPDTGELLTGLPMDRPMDMDVIPSPYLTGLMDQWFDGSYAPSIETARGCPFRCTFCFQGQKYFNTIARFSVERINAEFTYMAERMKDYPDILLNICDSNFGMYKRDLEFADHLRGLQDTHGWPNAFNVTTGKANYDRILEVAEKLRNKMHVSTSVQSLNDETLEIIERRNLPWDQYVAIQAEMKKRGMISMAETIIPMPMETKESFFEGLKKLNNVGVDFVSPYTTMMLKGTKLASREIRDKYEMATKYRILPRQFGEYQGHRCYEIEEVCIATNTMPYEEYVECRGFGLISATFTNTQYNTIERHLRELDLTTFDFVHGVWEKVKSGGTSLSPVYERYLQACHDELFDSREEIYRFFAAAENYDRLLKGELGDNLMRRYKNEIIVDCCSDAISIAYDTLEEIAKDRLSDRARASLRAAREWALSTRDLRSMFQGDEQVFAPRTLTLGFDVDAWYREGPDATPLTEFSGDVTYEILGERQKIESILAQGKKLYGDDYNFWMPKTLNNWNVRNFWMMCNPTSLAA